MARKNPKRRLIAKIKQWDAQAHEMTKAYNAEVINSTAPVRSCLRSFTTSHALRPPKGWAAKPDSVEPVRKGALVPNVPDADHGPRKGKVQGGKFVPNRGTFKRFGRD